ncbi:MAG: beta-lactamase family protein [Bacteroidales bacterium]|nr:beta-lactamase family protein [Bacteroidales bacterium]
MKKAFFSIAVLLCLALSLRADVYTPFLTEEQYPQQLWDTIVDRYDVEGLEFVANDMSEKLNGVMLVAVRDTVLVEHAYGELCLTGEPPRCNPEEDNQITETTLFDLASISKQFTAVAVLQLCAQGKISLDDTITEYFPNLPYSGVTIKHLLTHTTGIPEYFKFKYPVYGSSAFVDNQQLLLVLEKQKYAKTFATGSKFEYVNTNYAILAALVAKVSGKPFEEYVHENIFKPAGMKNTCFFTELVGIDAKHGKKYADVDPKAEDVNVKPLPMDIPIARGHRKVAVTVRYDRLNGVLGDKGIYSNVEDMLRWANAMFMDYKILPKEWVDLASQRENQLKDGSLPKSIYGFGYRIEESPAHGKLVYHGGLWNGFQNLFLYRPSDNVVIIFLSNLYNKAHAGRSDQMLNILDGIQEEVTEEEELQ